jgi:hypothetical protein
MSSTEHSEKVPDSKKKYEYFVDTVKYETDDATLTGLQIKERIQGFNPAYQLYLEGHGEDTDRLVSDGEGISLDPQGHGVRKFYTVPPATFGVQ